MDNEPQIPMSQVLINGTTQNMNSNNTSNLKGSITRRGWGGMARAGSGDLPNYLISQDFVIWKMEVFLALLLALSNLPFLLLNAKLDIF